MPETNQNDSGGLQLLIDWANEQDHWVRAIVSEVIATRRELSEQSVAAAYALLLAEKGLSKDTAPNIPPLSAGAAPTESSDDLRLVRLSGLTGVNALAAGQEIAFNKNLTVLFGENAAGKTGYVRVLKRVASVRSAKPILGNVHGTTGGKPHALLEYSLSGTAQSLNWNDEQGVPPLTRMNVFDSGDVALHVDADLTYVFTPRELALFQYVHQAIDAVKDRLEHEKNEALPKATSPFLHRFQRDAVIYPIIETLGGATSIADIEALANISPEEADSLPAIRDRVAALQPGAVQSRLLAATSDRDLYKAVQGTAQAAAIFPWEDYNAAVENVSRAETLYATTSKTAFEGESIPGIFGPSWKDFIAAGEAYIRETGAHEHPKQGDVCSYCQQGLGEKALALVRKYREFSNNEPRKTLDAAIASVKRIAVPLVGVQIPALKESCDRRIAAYTDAATVPPTLKKTVAFLEELQQKRTDIGGSRSVTGEKVLQETAVAISQEAADAVAVAEGAITDLGKQADERKQELDKETIKLRTLENRITLQTLLPEVRTYVERAQWAGRAAPLTNRASTAMRALTEKSKLASKELLDKDFERLFQAECSALSAPTVQLDFAGRKGQAARKKLLVPDHSLSETLSEGEQKVIALADFLAEAALQRTAAPIVFDDPVNSLDYRRLQYVVDRIVTLSATRQVIVFTHNIWFAVEILSRFEKSTGGCTYYGVSEDDGAKGIINPGSHPRWDTISKLGGRINTLIQDAGAATGETQSALIERAYDLVRSWCEVTTEQELLAGVAQRYQPNVAMTKLAQVKVDKLDAARSVILPLFEKACRFTTAHSQPLETLAVRPTLSELKSDWTNAQAARDAYIK